MTVRLSAWKAARCEKLPRPMKTPSNAIAKQQKNVATDIGRRSASSVAITAASEVKSEKGVRLSTSTSAQARAAPTVSTARDLTATCRAKFMPGGRRASSAWAAIDSGSGKKERNHTSSSPTWNAAAGSAPSATAERVASVYTLMMHSSRVIITPAMRKKGVSCARVGMRRMSGRPEPSRCPDTTVQMHSAAATYWPATVAHAAPAMPILRGPNTRKMSPTRLTAPAVRLITSGARALARA
mmetsp:Transcript_2687/g.8061  ORF Transcript_2687/g.8061 Transcript_2687/m.8061 type:complete len:241 (-) Transcript_2687:476-1198(-)